MSKAAKPRDPAAKKHRFNKPWMSEHVNDHWVQEAKRLGYRSRAAFKLLEVADRDKLLRPGMTVVDLGAAPGSWCQVLRQRLGKSGRIVAVDLLPIDPIAGVDVVRGDIGDDAVLRAIEKALDGRPVELVLSDLAPNISGIESADQAKGVYLAEMALDFALRRLQPGGDLVVKVFQGGGFAEFHHRVQRHFDKVYVRKPKASRDRSREVYLVGKRRIELLPDGDRSVVLAPEAPNG